MRSCYPSRPRPSAYNHERPTITKPPAMYHLIVSRTFFGHNIIRKLNHSQQSLFDNFQSAMNPLFSACETFVQIDEIVRDMLQLEMLVYFPALTEGLSIHSDGMDTSTELARYPRQRAQTFTVDVRLSPGASGLAAPLRTLAADTVVGEVCKSWSRGSRTTRDKRAYRLIILS